MFIPRFIGLIMLTLVFQSVIQASPLPPGETPPPTVFERIANAGKAADYEDADQVIISETKVNRVKESGVTEAEEYKLYKILTDEGCKQLAVLNWRYDPQSSYIEVLEVNIIRDKDLIPLNILTIRDLPAPQSAIYWNDRVKVLQLPRLFVGDGIEVRTYHKGFTYALLDNTGKPPDERYIPPMAGEYFDIVRFEGTVPIIEKKYVIYIPSTKRLHSQVYNGKLFSSTSYSADSTIYSWWALDIPAADRERYSPGATDLVTKVVMSTAEDWEAKSRWFFNVNEPQFEFTPEIKSKVDEIIAKAGVSRGSEEEKAEALLHWVAQNIRYSGQTMGAGEGFTLHSGAMIFRQRSGVCKDIAGMLVTMMRAAGMDSYAAMTMAGSRIEDLPADQFNHCVVALRKDDDSFEMYDPTWVPFNRDIWSKLESEQHYIIGTPEGERLSRIRYSPPEESPLFMISRAEIDEEGNLQGSMEFKSDGAMDSRLRRLVSIHPKADLTGYFEMLLSGAGNRIEQVAFEHRPLLDFSGGMWIKLKYAIPEFAQPVEDGFEFQSPMMQVNMHNRWLLRAGDHKWSEDRRDDVFLYYTQLLQGSEEIRLPKGYELINLPEKVHIDETYAAFEASVESGKRTMNVNQKIEIRRRQIPPSGYPGFRDAINGAAEFAETVFSIEKGGAK